MKKFFIFILILLLVWFVFWIAATWWLNATDLWEMLNPEIFFFMVFWTAPIWGSVLVVGMALYLVAKVLKKLIRKQ